MELQATSRWRREALSLFLLDEADVGETYVQWLNDPRVNRFLEVRFAPQTLDSTRDFVRSCRESSHSVLWGLRAAALGGRHVGNIKLGPIDRQHGLGELGLMLGEPESWGRGLARTAIDMVCEIGTHELGLRKFTAGCYAKNIGSERAFLAAGFHVEARRPAHFLLDGQLEDLVLLARFAFDPAAAAASRPA